MIDFQLERSQNAAPWLLLQELTHRVINEYSAAISSLSVAAAKASTAEAKSAISSALDRLYDYGTVYRALQRPHSDGWLDLSEYLHNICVAFARSRLYPRGITLTLSEEPIAMAGEDCWLVGLIVSELLTNAAKHAFGESSGAIRVELMHDDGRVQCRVIDNGKPSEQPRPGRGVTIVSALAAELNGNVSWMFTPRGTVVTLTFEYGDGGTRGSAPQTTS